MKLGVLAFAACLVSLTASAASQQRGKETRLLIPVADVESMVWLYTDRARVPIGLETMPGSAGPGLPREVPPLDLTGVPAADAIRRILAADPRYLSTNANGIINVRPKSAADRSSPWLGRTMTIALREQSANVLLDRLLVLFGGQPPSEPRRPRGKLLTLDLQKVTIREALNRICLAEGTLSWRFHAGPGAERGAHLIVELKSFDGWNAGTTMHAR
jgi:hypothetical protein